MRPKTLLLLGCLSALSGCLEGPSAPRIPPPPLTAKPVASTVLEAPRTDPTARLLDKDTDLKTATGATFQAARGWTVTTYPSDSARTTLQDPDLAITVNLLEIRDAEASQAVSTAWKKVHPDFARSVRESSTPPGRNGWEAVYQAEYETTTQEGREVFAVARRKGDLWYVALVEATRAAYDRRAAEVRIVLRSLRAPGATEESFQGRTAQVLDADKLQKLEAFVEECRQKAKLPGVAVSIVQKGKIVFEKGFGQREIGKREKVTPNTLFLIGSITKSLTSLMMARLVEEGKFSWDAPVTQLRPSFALGEAEATRRLTMKHTVCACTGLPRQDMEFLFEYAGVTPEKRIEELRKMVPTTLFGQTFQYSNPMVSAGGFIAAQTVEPKKPLGAAYDAVMKSRVFDPLGMKSTTFDFAAAARSDHASPHASDMRLEQHAVRLQDEAWVVPIRPAGGAWSSARDMAKYVLLELAKGKSADGKTIVSESNLLRRREPQVRASDKSSYGLALSVEDYRGVQILGHNGGTAGFGTLVFFLPEQDVGAVILTNSSDGSLVYTAVRRRLLELLFEGQPEASQDLDFSLKRRADAQAKELAKIQFEADPAWYGQLAGTYVNPNLGTVVVKANGTRALVDAGEWKSSAAQKREEDGTLKLVLLDAPWAGFEFIPSEGPVKNALTLERPQQKYNFDRRP